MSSGVQFDQAWSKRVEAIYLTSDVVAQRFEVLQTLAVEPGERVLDVGSGPGLLAREMARQVGGQGAVKGIDVSENMVAMARARCAKLPWVEFTTGDATALPYADNEFDAAVSTQVYEYVSDVPTALRELHRVLRPGGRALIVDTDWESLVWHTRDETRAKRVLNAFNEHCAHPDLPRKLMPLLRQLGFQTHPPTVFVLLNARYHEDTYSFGIIDFIASFVPGHQEVTAEQAQAWAEELRALGAADKYFFSLNRYFFNVTKPA